MRALIFSIFFLLSACNVYDLVGKNTEISDDLEKLLETPTITINPSQLSITDINTATTTGLFVKFSISNAQLNDFTTSGQVDDITLFSEEGSGSVTNLSLPTYAQKLNAQEFEIRIKSNGMTSTLSGEVYIRVQIPAGAYTSNNSQNLNYQDYLIELIP